MKNVEYNFSNWGPAFQSIEFQHVQLRISLICADLSKQSFKFNFLANETFHEEALLGKFTKKILLYAFDVFGMGIYLKWKSIPISIPCGIRRKELQILESFVLVVRTLTREKYNRNLTNSVYYYYFFIFLLNL